MKTLLMDRPVLTVPREEEEMPCPAGTLAGSGRDGYVSECPWLTRPASAAETGRHHRRATARVRRVLFVSYLFPPVGGAGVQRVTKFVKYLPEFGWQSSVLTAANPSVPAYDPSLEADVPSGTIITRARTLEPSYRVKAAISAGSQPAGIVHRLLKRLGLSLANAVLQPDPQILWLPAAVRAGSRLLDEMPHSAIIATGPPFSSFLVGAMLRRQTGLPLVLDYRDEWDLSHRYLENKRHGLLSRFIQRQMQRRAVKSASAVVATTRASARTLQSICTAADSTAHVTWISNGFDPEDFVPLPSNHRREANRFRLVYVGTLWNLTGVDPLVSALTCLAQRRPDLAARLELVIAGRRMASQDQHLDRLKGLPCRVTVHPYVGHAEALALLRSADALCLLLSDVSGAERVVPAKLFEYMAAGLPILAITPPGEVWDILQEYPTARCIVPRDVDSIVEFLLDRVDTASAIDPGPQPVWNSAQYDRRHQAGDLAKLLESLQPGSEA
jgi:glycosyltransferase involved in cell wall biosynthesis